jgi:hypothetical protein
VKFRGAQKGPNGEKALRAQRVFFLLAPKSTGNAQKAEIVVLLQ